MRNRPGYSLWKNAGYALDGFAEVLRNETAFKIEVTIAVVVWICLIFVPLPLIAKAVLGLSFFPVLIAELANSAIERVVDLATLEHHKLAKYAKDAGSAMVLFSVIFTILIWISTLSILYIGS
ncbi:diacylglycerol kinase [Hydrogenimonas sp.]